MCRFHARAVWVKRRRTRRPADAATERPAQRPRRVAPRAAPTRGGQQQAASDAGRVFERRNYDELLRCEVQDGGTSFRAATILRSKASPSDVVIWFDGSDAYEGLRKSILSFKSGTQNTDDKLLKTGCTRHPM